MRRTLVLLALGLATGCNDEGITKPLPPVTVQQKIVFSSDRDVAQTLERGWFSESRISHRRRNGQTRRPTGSPPSGVATLSTYICCGDFLLVQDVSLGR